MGERTLSTARVDLVRSGAQRVALAATGIVAALYLLIAVAVVLIVTHNLTSNVDGTLSQWLTSMAADRQTVTRGFPGPHGGPRIGDAPVLWWMWHPMGISVTAARRLSRSSFRSPRPASRMRRPSPCPVSPCGSRAAASAMTGQSSRNL